MVFRRSVKFRDPIRLTIAFNNDYALISPTV
jgi:hypothetical protein